jgi:hypothetical protein
MTVECLRSTGSPKIPMPGPDNYGSLPTVGRALQNAAIPLRCSPESRPSPTPSRNHRARPPHPALRTPGRLHHKLVNQHTRSAGPQAKRGDLRLLAGGPANPATPRMNAPRTANSAPSASAGPPLSPPDHLNRPRPPVCLDRSPLTTANHRAESAYSLLRVSTC